MINNIEQLISDVANKCVQNKINFRLEYAKHVDVENIPCSGYFDEKTLAVATKNNYLNWLGILIHESCHLDQFLEGGDIWIPDKDALTIVENWIHGKNVARRRLDKGFKNTIALELDCEKRSVQKIKKYDLPIEINDYIQKANAYLFSYMYAYVNKTWYIKPYEKKRICANMPTKFLTVDQYFDCNSEYFALFI